MQVYLVVKGEAIVKKWQEGHQEQKRKTHKK